MAKYTNVAIFPNATFAAGNFTNANNVLNDSTSSYATSETMSYAASDAIGCQWTPQHIQAIIPIGAIIDSITVRVVAKFSDSGSGSFFKMYRSFDILNVNSTTCEYTDSPNLKFSNSFTTLDYQLPQVSNDFITKGFSARLAFKNTKLFSTRTVYVATVKLLVSYTVPEYTLTVNASPPEGGIVTGGGTYESGSDVTLTAAPNNGYVFSHWKVTDDFGNTMTIPVADYTLPNIKGNLYCTGFFEEVQTSKKIRYGAETAKSVFDTNKNKAKSVWYGATQIL